MLTDRLVAPATYFKHIIDNVIGKEDVVFLFNTDLTGDYEHMGPERKAWTEWKRAFDRKVRMRAVEVDKEATAIIAKADLIEQIKLPKDGSPVLVVINTAGDLINLTEYAKSSGTDMWSLDTLDQFICHAVLAAQTSPKCKPRTANAPHNANANGNANANKTRTKNAA